MAYCLDNVHSMATQCAAVKRALILIKTKFGFCLCSPTYYVSLRMPSINLALALSLVYFPSCCENQPPLIMEGCFVQYLLDYSKDRP